MSDICEKCGSPRLYLCPVCGARLSFSERVSVENIGLVDETGNLEDVEAYWQSDPVYGFRCSEDEEHELPREMLDAIVSRVRHGRLAEPEHCGG